MSKPNFRSLLVLSLVLLPCAAWADGVLAMTGVPHAEFTAQGPGGLKILGETQQVGASDLGDKLAIKVKLGQLKTGMSLRDTHTHEALEADKFPEAVLTVTKGELKFPTDGQELSGQVTGQLLLHGVTRDTRFDYKVKRQGDVLTIDGSAPVNILDFQIKKPCYLGVCVDEHIKVGAKFQLHQG